MNLTFAKEIKPEDYEAIIGLLKDYQTFQKNHEHGHFPLFDDIPNWDIEEFLKLPGKWAFVAKDNDKIVAFAAGDKSKDKEGLSTLDILVFSNFEVGEQTYLEFEKNANDLIAYNLSKRMLDYAPFLEKYPQYIYLLPGEKELRLCFIAKTAKSHNLIKKYKERIDKIDDFRPFLHETQREGVTTGKIVILKENG